MNDLYPLRVRQNILPLSMADNLPSAFKEWFFTEEIYDHEATEADCQLCNKEELRYHFKIRNELTQNTLWVGSSCILKFGLSVLEDGKILSAEAAKKKLDALTRKMQFESCIKALETLSELDNNILRNALEYFKREKKLTPKQAFVVFWQMQERAIDHHPSFFTIALKKGQHQNDLREMETSRVHKFWSALSSSQKNIAQKLGHLPPP